MSAYYFYDGRNEIGPLTVDLLKKQKLSRNTPVRQLGSEHWMPAERLASIRELVAPRKIKKPQDLLPAAKEYFADLKQRKPRVLYGGLLCLALLLGVSIFSVTQDDRKKLPNVPPAYAVALEARQPVPVAETVTSKGTQAEKKAPSVTEDKARATRLRWSKLISATNSNYGIGLLGGIKDLRIIATNRTDYPIDYMVIKLTYIKGNGGVWKTVPITVHGIAAHDSKEQSVPDASRGKKVKTAILKVVSRKMNFSYTEGKKGQNPADPYVIK